VEAAGVNACADELLAAVASASSESSGVNRLISAGTGRGDAIATAASLCAGVGTREGGSASGGGVAAKFDGISEERTSTGAAVPRLGA